MKTSFYHLNFAWLKHCTNTCLHAAQGDYMYSISWNSNCRIEWWATFQFLFDAVKRMSLMWTNCWNCHPPLLANTLSCSGRLLAITLCTFRWWPTLHVWLEQMQRLVWDIVAIVGPYWCLLSTFDCLSVHNAISSVAELVRSTSAQLKVVLKITQICTAVTLQ